VAGGKTPAVRMVKLYIGRVGVPGWNEIDAVGLIDARGTAHWAVDISASSWYGQSYSSASSPAVAPEMLLPSWSGLTAPPRNIPPGLSQSESRGADARGWPFLALWTPFDPQRLAKRSTAS